MCVVPLSDSLDKHRQAGGVLGGDALLMPCHAMPWRAQDGATTAAGKKSETRRMGVVGLREGRKGGFFFYLP